jgi:hypothetical protein
VKKEPAPPQQMHAPQWKQIAVVDKRGMPYGNAATYLSEDIKKFAKGLNPIYGWGDQPLEEKQRFFDRIAAGTSSLCIFICRTCARKYFFLQMCVQSKTWDVYVDGSLDGKFSTIFNVVISVGSWTSELLPWS